jgi:hypothetical protein
MPGLAEPVAVAGRLALVQRTIRRPRRQWPIAAVRNIAEAAVHGVRTSDRLRQSPSSPHSRATRAAAVLLSTPSLSKICTK